MSYTGNGAANNYSFTYKIFNQGDLLVTVRHPTTGVETPLTITTDYTVTIASNGTGSITLVNASQAWLTGGFLTTAWKIVIRRVVDITQETDIRNQGAFFPETHENAFDYMTMISQQLKDEIGRSVKVAETDDPLTTTLPTATERAGRFLAFDANGEPIAATALTGTPVSSFMETLLDDSNATDARTTLGFTGSGGTVATANIADDAVTDAKLRNSAALSVIGRSADSVGSPADIVAATDGHVFRRAGTSVGFGKIAKTVRTVTTTDTSTDEDEVVLLSAASAYNFTLHTPTYNQTLVLKRTDDALANAISIVGTIDGVTNKKLHTQNESYTLQYNTATSAWRMLDHYTRFYKTGGTLTIGATTTAPTKGTVVRDNIILNREGRYAVYTYQYRQTSAGGATGSGDYLFTLGYGLTADLTEHTAYTTVGNPNETSTGWGFFPTFSGLIRTSTAGLTAYTIFPYSTTQVRLFGGNQYSSVAMISSTFFALNNNVILSFSFKVPITDWTD